MSATTPIRRSSCTGTGSSFRPMWMERRKRARLLFLRTVLAEFRLCRSPLVCASITRTSAREPIWRAGQYSGLVGPVYIEPKQHAGNYDREVFLTLKEFQPTLSRGGDMAMDFLSPAQTVPALKDAGESKMKASLAKGMPHGFEVGYDSFTINGRMLGHGDPVRVKQGERVLFHILNGSATEIRSLALPGHSFNVVAMDGNPVAEAGARAGSLAGNRGANFSDRGNEPSRSLGDGRPGRRRSSPRHGRCRRVRRI